MLMPAPEADLGCDTRVTEQPEVVLSPVVVIMNSVGQYIQSQVMMVFAEAIQKYFFPGLLIQVVVPI
jgi:hypothetical protein